MANQFFIIAQVLSVIALIANVIGIQLNEKRQILKVWIVAFIFFTASFIFLGAYAGAASCFIASVQIITNYAFERKNKKFPFYLTIIFIIVSIIGGALTYQNIFDVLPILGAITYIWSIAQEKESRIRKITLLNLILWVFYDFLVKAYVASISDLIFLASTLVAIIRFDVFKQKSKEKDGNILT